MWIRRTGLSVVPGRLRALVSRWGTVHPAHTLHRPRLCAPRSSPTSPKAELADLGELGCRSFRRSSRTAIHPECRAARDLSGHVGVDLTGDAPYDARRPAPVPTR